MANEKAKYWVAVCYPENMVKGWEDKIYNLVQVPFCYCIHDKDLIKDTEDTSRKTHVHIILAFPNTTTYKHALSVYKLLGENCVNTCKQIISINRMYDYLIHDTEDCRKAHKHIYEKSERIEGNNFDIGCFIQEDLHTKLEKIMELSDLICDKAFTNYMRFFMHVRKYYDSSYVDCVLKNKSHFNYLCKGVFNDIQFPYDTIKDMINKRYGVEEE